MSLLKLLYLVQQNLSRKWDTPVNGWNLTYSQLLIIFEDRLTKP